MLRRLTLMGFFLSIIVFLAACEGAIEYTIIDERPVLGEVYIETTDEIDNSLGTSDLEQNLSLLRQFSADIQLELKANSGLDEGDVRDRILTEYQLAGAEQQKQCVIPVSVPPGSIHQYDVQWTQELREGRIEEGAQGGGDVLGTYTIVIDLRCEVTGMNVVR